MAKFGNFMHRTKAVFLALIFTVIPLQIVIAQDVALTSADGTLTIEGRLLSFDGEYYQIRSSYGDLTLDGSGVSCDGPGCPSLEAYVARARIAGSAVLGETLMPVLIEGFARQEGFDLRRVDQNDRNFTYELYDRGADKLLAEFIFDLSDTPDGVAALQRNDADFALARFAYEGSEFPLPRVLALDAVTFSVAPENPMRAIPFDVLSDLLRGEVGNWNELGGPDMPLVSIGGDPDMDGALVLADIFTSQDHQRGNVQASDQILRDNISIGVTRLSDPGTAIALRLTGACGADFVPVSLNLKTRDYPLASPQFLYQSKQRKPRVVRQFLQYLSTDHAARDAEFSGFTSHSLVEIPIEAQGARIANAVMQAGDDTSLQDLQEMILELRNARRLTLTFRFRAGSTRLDTLSDADLDVLVHHIETGRFDGKELIFAGFSDGMGGAVANQRIALRRATAIRAAVLERSDLVKSADVALTVTGFGEAMPLACDDSEFGREMNRRVELWVRDVPVSID